CSFETTGRSGIELVGSQGRVEIPSPWLPGTAPAVVRVSDRKGQKELKTKGANHYRLMVEHFDDCILNQHPPTFSPEDALENMRVLDALRRSATEGRRVTLAEV